jgi:small subunit ribosomal protein S8
MQDPISDMFTRIRNGQLVAKAEVAMFSSKLKTAIAKVLKEEGYIADYVVTENGNIPMLAIKLKYYQDKPVIEMINRVSRPGIRIYKAASDIPKVRGGLGISIVSTPKGVMSCRAARAINQGGELIAEVA